MMIKNEIESAEPRVKETHKPWGKTRPSDLTWESGPRRKLKTIAALMPLSLDALQSWCLDALMPHMLQPLPEAVNDIADDIM